MDQTPDSILGLSSKKKWSKEQYKTEQKNTVKLLLNFIGLNLTDASENGLIAKINPDQLLQLHALLQEVMQKQTGNSSSREKIVALEKKIVARIDGIHDQIDQGNYDLKDLSNQFIQEHRNYLVAKAYPKGKYRRSKTKINKPFYNRLVKFDKMMKSNKTALNIVASASGHQVPNVDELTREDRVQFRSEQSVYNELYSQLHYSEIQSRGLQQREFSSEQEVEAVLKDCAYRNATISRYGTHYPHSKKIKKICEQSYRHNEKRVEALMSNQSVQEHMINFIAKNHCPEGCSEEQLRARLSSDIGSEQGLLQKIIGLYGSPPYIDGGTELQLYVNGATRWIADDITEHPERWDTPSSEATQTPTT